MLEILENKFQRHDKKKEIGMKIDGTVWWKEFVVWEFLRIFRRRVFEANLEGSLQGLKIFRRWVAKISRILCKSVWRVCSRARKFRRETSKPWISTKLSKLGKTQGAIQENLLAGHENRWNDDFRIEEILFHLFQREKKENNKDRNDQLFFLVTISRRFTNIKQDFLRFNQRQSTNG